MKYAVSTVPAALVLLGHVLVCSAVGLTPPTSQSRRSSAHGALDSPTGRGGVAIQGYEEATFRRSADELVNLIATPTGAGANGTGLPGCDEFMRSCLEHVKGLVATIDQSYTDKQIQGVLENECLLEKAFPNVTEDGFNDEKSCMVFAKKLTAARHAELADGSQTGYGQFCSSYYMHLGGDCFQKAVAPSSQPEQKEKGGSGFWWKISFIVLAVVVLVAIGLYAARRLRQRPGAAGAA
mmetsp:Transcript_19646/g.53866  ORF Transcript_19646/g.53866 Transcript_19646/m.53866 type:complete len:238 (+) Transcript_19646:28-741(+)